MTPFAASALGLAGVAMTRIGCTFDQQKAYLETEIWLLTTQDRALTDRFPLTRGADAFAALGERRGLKIVVEPERPPV